ncbi:MFS transporter [Variovorax defluvii]|uniref:MFS transporter n=1 Tax=Variovorax defluvii TaxID=913761 RepID=A0ABP8I137_9BURK
MLASIPNARQVDSAYSWAVALATLAMASLSFGAVTSVPILFGLIAQDFGWEHGRVALVHTAAMACAGLGSIVLGRLLDRRGFFPIAVSAAIATGTGLVLASHASSFWQMALAFGLLVGGLGQGAFFSPLAAAVSHWFDKHRGVAVSIALCGQSVGGLVIPPLLRVAAEHHGWRSALQGYGLICSGCMLAAAAFYLPSHPPSHAAPDGGHGPARPTHRSGITFLLGAALYCSNTALFGIASHMVAYGEGVGMGPAAAGALMSALFGITLFSRLGVGAFLARGGVFRVIVAMSLLHMAGTWIVFSSGSPATLVVGLLAMGLGFGGYLPAFGSLVRGIFPAREAGRRLSELYLLGFFGAGTGSWLVGALRDWRGGQWDASFLVMASLAAVGPAILLARRRDFAPVRTSQ